MLAQETPIKCQKETNNNYDDTVRKYQHLLRPKRIKHRQHSPNPQSKELKRLLDLVSRSVKYGKESGEKEGPLGKTLQWPSPVSADGQFQEQASEESVVLEKFSLSHQKERNFSQHANHELFAQIFSTLVQQRLSVPEWIENAPPENILRVIMCLRIFMRDPEYQSTFADLGGIKVLARYLQKATDSYLTYGDGPLVSDILTEMTNIFHKLSTNSKHRDSVVKLGVYKPLVLLLSASDVIVLHSTLHALTSLAQSPEPCSLIAELNSIEILLRILQEFDPLSKQLAANLLRLLCADPQAKEMIKVFDGIPLLLSLLHSDSLKLLWNAVWCLVQLSSDKETSDDVRQMGGIPLLLSLLHDRKFISERASSGMGSASIRTPDEEFWSWPSTPVKSPDGSTSSESDLKQGYEQLSLQSACCACLTELVLNDTNAQQIVHCNGLYSLGLLIMPRDTTSWQNREIAVFNTLQANAFRTLRFLFSMERNRRHFKRLFPPDLFEMFIDIGHYKRDIKAYRPLVEKINSLDKETLKEILENLETSNQNKEPTKHIGEYSVLELLGTGAFGSVYKVKKQTAGQSYLAMKEINTMNPSWGKSSKERQKSVGDVVSELQIIREQLKHPNVVRYYKTFVEQEKLFIVMELIEGAPIGEHFNSLKEKEEHFSEDRIWHIFVQLVLALRYLHKEKGIVHRDLTPNNIMLGENDKVTITDFGLAKQKQQDCSKMTSVVGTILYSCPEIVQNQPYGEKADVWAIGCILYQMCTLNPPFLSNNMLSLATKIVNAEYEPVPESLNYSPLVVSCIRTCIEADPSVRPDIVGVAAHIAERMLVHLDEMHRDQIHLEKKLEREQRRTQKHFYEANRNMQNYHRLFQVSQERYDKLVNLASSGGASSIKDESEMGDVFNEASTPPSHSSRTIVPNSSTDSYGEYPNFNGWASEDDGSSSGSDGQMSRDSSNSAAALVATRSDSRVPRPPEGNPRGRRNKGCRNSCFNQQLAQQLTLDIPSKYSRDSGISSGDPSPNTIATPPPSAPSSISSNGSLENAPAAGQLTRPKSYPGGQRSLPGAAAADAVRKTSAGIRTRPSSAAPATLTISPRKVREINDPISQMLNQLHKIIYITQLPPTLCHNPKRKIVERFKRMLFAPRSTSFNLKNELKKLLNGSRDVVDMHFGASESQKLARQVSQEQAEALNPNNEKAGAAQVIDTDAGAEMITYEQMHTIIEGVLMESGYYDMSTSARNRTFPSAPLGPSTNYNGP